MNQGTSASKAAAIHGATVEQASALRRDVVRSGARRERRPATGVSEARFARGSVAEYASPNTSKSAEASPGVVNTPRSPRTPGESPETLAETNEARVTVRSVGMQRSIERILRHELRRAATPGGAPIVALSGKDAITH